MLDFGKLGVSAALAFSLVGCDVAMGDDQMTTAWRQPLQGKADADDGADGAGAARVRGMLGFGPGGAVEAAFDRDLETHAWVFRAPRGSVVALEVTGAASGQVQFGQPLDTNLTVFGPQRADGGFGEVAIGHDDDSGAHGHAWLEALLLPRGAAPDAEGTWLAVVGTNEDRGRGTYRLELRCVGGACLGPGASPEIPESCPEALLGQVRSCLGGMPYADLATPWGDAFDQSLRACASVGRVQGWCGGPGAGQPGCTGLAGWEELSQVCREDLRERLVDEACVLGRSLEEGLRSAEAVLVVGEDVLDGTSTLSERDRSRLRWVAGRSGRLVGELLEAPGGVKRQALWDASNREALEAYTMSHLGSWEGAVFFADSDAVAAEVSGGRVTGCALPFGPERRRCAGPEDCAEGLRCLGMPQGLGTDASGAGRCVDSRQDRQKQRDMPCTSDWECGRADGLVCGGLGLWEHGRCVPAWQRGSFAGRGGEIPDGDVGGLSVAIPVWGLPGMVGDLRVSLDIRHSRIRDLRVTLEHQQHGGAAGWGELVLFSGERDGDRLLLEQVPVSRLERDQPAAGMWRLRVQDLASGGAGRVLSARLELTAL